LIKLFINGINGKMGTEVATLANSRDDIHLLGGYDKCLSQKNKYSVYNNYEEIFEKPDVIIDFSSPEATIELLNFAIDKKIPVVIATTGFNNEQKEFIIKCSKKIPIFHSSNMSFEINLMKNISSYLAENLKDAEIEIVETHHSRKKDAPSGTALMIAEAIQNSQNNSFHYNYDRFKNSQKRDPKEIGFSSIRGGNIVGEHTVIFFKENEVFEVTHKALSRNIFAEGAINAAEFILNKPCGYYTSQL